MRVLFILLFTLTLQAQELSLRVGVIGGVVSSGLWEVLEKDFEQLHHIKLELIATGPKHTLIEASKGSPLDIITMHASDAITNLVADGHFESLTPWLRNSQALIGVASNPAKLDSKDSLKTMFEKIVKNKTKFIIHYSTGTSEVLHEIFYQYNIKLDPKQIIYVGHNEPFMKIVKQNSGYTLFGQIPYYQKKHYQKGLRLFYEDDQYLQRPYLMGIAKESDIGKERYLLARQFLKYIQTQRVKNIIDSFREENSQKRVFYSVY